MKIIDLLNKIANGEIDESTIIEFDNGYNDYCSVRVFFDRYIMDKENLNLEIKLKEDEIQPEDVLSFTLTDKVWTPRQARELIDSFRKISEKLKSKKDNNKIEKLKRITKCIGTDEEGTYYTDEYTIPELVVKIDEIIDKLNNME